MIAVLPFENLSGDPGQQYFSDGITEDITDRLTRFRALSVIGKHSAFAFRGSAPDFGAIRDKLKADFVVSGSIRRSETRIRIAARLTDAASETAIWAEHYDRPLADLFDFRMRSPIFWRPPSQDCSKSRLPHELAANRPPASTAMNYMLRGQWHFDQFTRPGNDEAVACFSRAVEIDPQNAYALAWLALSHINRWMHGFFRRRPEIWCRTGRASNQNGSHRRARFSDMRVRPVLDSRTRRPPKGSTRPGHRAQPQ